MHEPSETGPLVIDGALIGTTALDIYSIDAATCRRTGAPTRRARSACCR
ncbi:MAG: hypothetical protein U1F20_06290 [Lysobacterales bacterium]